MAVMETCRACSSPAMSGMHFCPTCLLTPLSPVPSQVSVPSQVGVSSGANDQAVTLQPGTRIDRFLVKESLGVGGFSEVHSVKDCEAPNRPPLAIKVMRMGLNSTEFLTRFEQEHFVLRRLEDAGIVRVFESGITDDGRPYFVMEKIDGLRITDYCQTEKLSLESRVELFVAVCRAVHHAHQKGIIHRDLKPANILVTHRDGLSIPYVIDFGLAKAVQCWNDVRETKTSEAWVTRLGVTMGTPGYISPEQADGTEDSDTLSDVFSLGAVLYELLTGRPPWPHETWKQVPHSKWATYKREHLPLKPSSIGVPYTTGRRIDDDLDTICSKALATDREQRYESVSQLATDLNSWLKGDQISAKPPSLTYRVRKLMSRYRWQSATLIASLVTCLVSAIFGVTLAIRERRYSTKLAVERTAAIDAKFHANELRELAIRERTEAERTAYASSVNLATVQIENRQPYLAQKILNSTQASLRSWEWNYLASLLPQPVLSIPTALDKPASLAVSQNHLFAAVCDGYSISRLDLKHGTAWPPCKVQARVQHVAISDDGQYIGALTHQAPMAFIKVYQFRSNDAAGGAEELTEVWSRQVHPDASLSWEMASESSNGLPALIVAEGNGAEPNQGSVLKLSTTTGEVLFNSPLKRWKLADKGLLVRKSVAVVRCSFDRLAVLRLSDLSVAGYVCGELNNLIEDFDLNAEESQVVFAQVGAVYEATWDQPELDVTDIQPNKLLKCRFDVASKFGGIHRLNRMADDGSANDGIAGDDWMAITDTHCLIEGRKRVALPAKIETHMVSLLDGTYATVLPHGVFEIRPEIQDLKVSRLAGRAVPPIPEGRRAVIAPSAEYCLYQTWSRQNIYRCSLLAGSDYDTFATPENKKLEWSRLPVFHPDGTAIIASPSVAADTLVPVDELRTAELVALRWDGEQAQSEPLPIETAPWSAAASPNGEKLFVGTMRGVTAMAWLDRELLQEWPLEHGPFVVMPMADSLGVYAIGVDHVVHTLRFDADPVASQRLIDEVHGPIPAHSDYLTTEQVLAISDPSGVRMFTLSESHAEIGLLPVEASVTALRFSADGKRLAIATSNRKISIWDWKGKHLLIELGTRGTCSSIDFSPDGRWLVNTDYDPCLTIR